MGHILLPKRRLPSGFDRLFRGPNYRHQTVNSARLINPEYYIAFKRKQGNTLNTAKAHTTLAEQKGGYRNKMRSYVQFLSTPTADTPGTTLLLHFDDQRYLIGNIAEGTQRAAMQRKLGLLKVGDIFLTGTVNWGNAGGLLGMILTLADIVKSSGKSKLERYGEKLKKGEVRKLNKSEHLGEGFAWLNIHGGKNLTHLLATARRFIFRTGMPIRITEFKADSNKEMKEGWEPTWQDKRLKVWAMVIEPENHAEPEDRRARKRSHEEFIDDALDGKPETSEEREDRYDQMRKAVVSHMFESEWKLDTLMKMKLSRVLQPEAKLFVRDERGKVKPYDGPTIAENPETPDIDVLVRAPWPGALVETLPPTTPSASSVCYILKNFPQRGKFNVEAAKKLGVKPGPMFSALAAFQAVTLANGTVVTPDQVLEPTKEGGGIALIELPTEAHIEPLLARKEWSSQEVMVGIGAAVWILGPGLTEDPRLLKFMQEHSELKHIVSSKDCCSNYLALESPAAAAINHHMLDPERFPIPKYNNELPSQKSESPLPYEPARVYKSIHLEPKFEVRDDEIIQYLDTAKVVQDANEDVLKLAKAASEEISSTEYKAELDENQKDIPSQDAEVISLGTGSAMPSKYRNVSATLLRVPGYGTYLFDCGENTLGQLKRVFGNELPEVLRDLKVIWISHLHADHHLGTVSAIKAWADETARDESTKSNKLIVASDEGMLKWMKEYAEVEDYGYERVQSIPMMSSGYYESTEKKFEPEQTQKFGLTSIQACLVSHCKASLAVAFNFPNGFKVAFSGDCRPSTTFAKMGKGATLLIHEATFDDSLDGEALVKRHCTTSDALEIGRKMGARRILLTHFSQRYQKLPVMESHKGKDQVAIVAFDYMRCKIGDFAKVESFKPALVKLYDEEAVNPDTKELIREYEEGY